MRSPVHPEGPGLEPFRSRREIMAFRSSFGGTGVEVVEEGGEIVISGPLGWSARRELKVRLVGRSMPD